MIGGAYEQFASLVIDRPLKFEHRTAAAAPALTDLGLSPFKF